MMMRSRSASPTNRSRLLRTSSDGFHENPNTNQYVSCMKIWQSMHFGDKLFAIMSVFLVCFIIIILLYIMYPFASTTTKQTKRSTNMKVDRLTYSNFTLETWEAIIKKPASRSLRHSPIGLNHLTTHANDYRHLLHGISKATKNSMNLENLEKKWLDKIKKGFYRTIHWIEGGTLTFESFFRHQRSRTGYSICLTASHNHVSNVLSLIYAVHNIHKFYVPIEIFYGGPSDFPWKKRQQVLNRVYNRSLVHFVDVATTFDINRMKVHGWDLKPLALLLACGEDVLLVDADTAFLQSPKLLFDMAGYQQSRALFFTDRTLGATWNWKPGFLMETAQPSLSKLALSLRSRVGATGYEQEAGAVAVNAKDHFWGILAVASLFAKPNIKKPVVTLTYGDKEAYFVGMEMIGAEYSFAKYLPGTIGFVHHENKKEALCGRLLHFDDKGLPLWTNGGYWTREDDFNSSFAIQDQMLRPLRYINGGICQNPNQEWIYSQKYVVFCLPVSQASGQKEESVPLDIAYNSFSIVGQAAIYKMEFDYPNNSIIEWERDMHDFFAEDLINLKREQANLYNFTVNSISHSILRIY